MTELDADGVPLLTYREAARRVRRSVRTLWRWRKGGMPMGWGIREGQRVRVVREDVLLEWWRARLVAWPIHQQRMRRLLNDNEGES